jgi:hypothetical protein
MTENETRRIAILTTGAIKTTTESAVKAMMAAVEAAEEKTREMRQATEQYIADFEKVTNSLADNVDAHVASCQAAIDSFQEHHLKILNGNIAEPTPPPEPRIVEKKPDLKQADLEDLKKLALSAVKTER